jgi:hypothetical protein
MMAIDMVMVINYRLASHYLTGPSKLLPSTNAVAGLSFKIVG